MSGITTHVLDTSTGRPAAGLAVKLERLEGAQWTALAERATDADGRVRDLLPSAPAPHGTYRLTFVTGAYLGSAGGTPFYPEVTVVFAVTDDRHHHVPLLLSPFGYSTYRGS